MTEHNFSSSVPFPRTGPQAPLRLGGVHLGSRYLLAPLAGYTNLAFRMAVRGLGGLGLATTDLINARALLMGSRKTMELLQTCPQDRPVAFQIYGSNPGELKEAAQWLESQGASTVDLNMGCPVHKIVRGGGGSALLCDAVNTVKLVSTIVDGVTIPVTVKMRLGWDASDLSAPLFAREFEQVGVAGITIHGRTRAQGFTGSVDLQGIRAVVESVQKIPIIGNGDVRTIADAERMLRMTGCAGIAIGRGALLNPWIFRQLQRWEETNDPGPMATGMERLEFMDQHFHLLTEHKPERFACLSFRKVANWYCRVLKPGREIQARLMRLESIDQFEEIVGQIRTQITQRGGLDWVPTESTISVPGGPIEHW